MTVTFGANTELSRCLAPSIRGSDEKLGPLQRFSHRFQPLSVAADKLGAARSSTRNSRRLFSVAKNNSGESLTYKDAGVDIDAGSELVRRIAKMAPGIGGFGGLFPLGIIFFFFYCGCKFFLLPLFKSCKFWNVCASVFTVAVNSADQVLTCR